MGPHVRVPRRVGHIKLLGFALQWQKFPLINVPYGNRLDLNSAQYISLSGF